MTAILQRFIIFAERILKTTFQTMITFPCCKINLGLNIVAKRPDGYHDLETVFYPIPLCDALEIKKMDEEFPSPTPVDLKVTGNSTGCDENENLVVKAYQIIAHDYALPRVHAHLVKRIPMQAGLGGGSSDAAYMIRLLDERFRLNMGSAEMERYAAGWELTVPSSSVRRSPMRQVSETSLRLWMTRTVTWKDITLCW